MTSATAIAQTKSLPAGPALQNSARLSKDTVIGSSATKGNLKTSAIKPSKPLGSDLALYLLTFGPGDHPFFKFGHDAIWLHDDFSGLDLVYNYGTFNFSSPWLILDFLKGKLTYWLSVDSLRATVASYSAENRSIVAQKLNLTPQERLSLARKLAINARLENKYYKYDYYLDNCATRIRDIIDITIDGRLKATATAKAQMTWRQHTLRHTADNLPVYLGLHVIMGNYIDRNISVWDEMFLPVKLQETIGKTEVITPTGEEPLVQSEFTLVTAARPVLRTSPPAWLIWFLLVGLALGGVFIILTLLAYRQHWRWAKVAVALILAAAGLVSGLLGLIFVCLWAFTDHVVAFHNENILQYAPWSLLLLPAAIRLLRGDMQVLPKIRSLLLVLVIGSLMGLLLKLLPWFNQQNFEFIALMLPFWVGLFVAIYLWERSCQASTRHVSNL
ncbi:MAG: DUF4105 domain-containing protein [Deltaproteobacteria bacterium]|nr:DUF4105 domain-containing protein [Deltaproteobacteria bacterium]